MSVNPDIRPVRLRPKGVYATKITFVNGSQINFLADADPDEDAGDVFDRMKKGLRHSHEDGSVTYYAFHTVKRVEFGPRHDEG